MRKPALLVGTAALTVIAVSTAGCTSSGSTEASSDPAGATTSSAATSASSTGTTAPPTDSSPAGSTTAAGTTGSTASSSTGRTGPGRCAETQLRASIDPRHIPGNGTPDSSGRARHAVLVDFRNKSGSTCTLTGYPGAAIEDSANHQVRQARRTLRGSLGGLPDGQTGYASVTLRPGQSAAAMLEGSDQREQGAAQAGCDAARYPRILVTPPNTTIPVPFSTGWPRCYSFDVHPVRLLPGT